VGKIILVISIETEEAVSKAHVDPLPPKGGEENVWI